MPTESPLNRPRAKPVPMSASDPKTRGPLPRSPERTARGAHRRRSIDRRDLDRLQAREDRDQAVMQRLPYSVWPPYSFAGPARQLIAPLPSWRTLWELFSRRK
jgi:hypothetical protein